MNEIKPEKDQGCSIIETLTAMHDHTQSDRMYNDIG